VDEEEVGLRSFSAATLCALVSVTLCIALGGSVLFEAAWQQWRFNGSTGHELIANDPRSQREASLERKVLALATSLLPATDIKVSVQVESASANGQVAELKSVLLIIDRAQPDNNIEESLLSLVSAGLAINSARGDQLAVRFHPFPSINDTAYEKFGLSPSQRMLLGLGISLLGLIGSVLLFHHYRKIRAKTLQLENDYRDQLLRFKAIAQEEPARVASVLSGWLNGTPLK
tara:strand:- start:88 stop:780 length:693 start_codon:yes stop_codon:yes gene_type:complete